MSARPHLSSTSSATAEADAVISARGVTKSFGDSAALAGFDLKVKRGKCVGLLGPNGAGKSTFIGCLYGAVLRNSGELRVLGYDPAHEPRRIKQRLGVVPQENALDEGLTVLENMQLYARFGGLRRTAILPRVDELLKEMALDHQAGCHDQDALRWNETAACVRSRTAGRSRTPDPG